MASTHICDRCWHQYTPERNGGQIGLGLVLLFIAALFLIVPVLFHNAGREARVNSMVTEEVIAANVESSEAPTRSPDQAFLHKEMSRVIAAIPQKEDDSFPQGWWALAFLLAAIWRWSVAAQHPYGCPSCGAVTPIPLISIRGKRILAAADPGSTVVRT